MSKHKEFHVAKTLRVRLGEAGEWLGSVSRSSGEFFLATEMLALLQEITRGGGESPALAARLRKTLEQAARTSPDAAEIATLLEDLHGAGLLAVAGGRAKKDALLADGFGDPWVQWAMLADRRRGEAYEKAISQAVGESDIVVDVGAGTGLLSAMALRAGAKKVFAIEETASAARVAPLLRALGLPHARPRFELHQGNSAEASLPAGVTLVMSELFGNDPFCEGVIPTLRDVAARFGAKKVRYVPRALEVFVEPCRLLGSPVHERVAALWNARGESGRSADDIHTAFLAHAARELPLAPLSFAVPVRADEIERAGPVQSLGVVRLDPPSSPVVAFAGEKEMPLDASSGGATKNAAPLVALLWFRVQLDGRTTLSNHPAEKDACGHWSPLIVPLAPAFALEARKAKGALVRFALSPFEDHLHLEIVTRSGVLLGSR